MKYESYMCRINFESFLKVIREERGREQIKVNFVISYLKKKK